MLKRLPDAHETRHTRTLEPLPVSFIVVDARRTARARTVATLLSVSGFSLLSATDAVAGVPLLAPNSVTEAPLVALLDWSLAKPDGLAGCYTLRAASTRVRIVITGMTTVHDDVAAFIHAGATGFILSSATPTQLIETVRHVANDEASLPRALTVSLFSQIRDHDVFAATRAVPDVVRLTKRERQIVGLLREGLSNKEIAVRLFIAIHTVKRHVHNILEKLALHSRLEVAAFARTTGSRS